MNQRVKFFITLGIAVIVIISFFWASNTITKTTGHAITGGAISSNVDTEALAKCLTASGAKMYGAYWCPHCQDQKTEFGTAVEYLPYVECDVKGPNAQVQACNDAGITGYPTWIINGKKYQGAQSLDKLKELAGC